MFCVEVVTDTIKVQASDLHSGSTLTIINHEIDMIYPNRVIMDVGLAIGRFDVDADRSRDNTRGHAGGGAVSSSASTVSTSTTAQFLRRHPKYVTKLGHGSCQESCSHFNVTFALIVFRPFVGEVLIGTIVDASEFGVQVSLGFFSSVFIPVHWMLNPSVYENGVWVWIPSYDDADGGDDGTKVKTEDETDVDADADAGPQRYEMNLGATIRFRVKSINYTQVTATAKGMQAVTSSTLSHHSFPKTSNGSSMDHHDETKKSPLDGPLPVRRRSSSVGLDDGASVPSSMHIVASICEDGLGLTSWWNNEEDDGADEDVDS